MDNVCEHTRVRPVKVAETELRTRLFGRSKHVFAIHYYRHSYYNTVDEFSRLPRAFSQTLLRAIPCVEYTQVNTPVKKKTGRTNKVAVWYTRQ